jgi:hypothetical protein
MKKWFQVMSFGVIGLVFTLSDHFDLQSFGTIQAHEGQESSNIRPEAIKNNRNFKSLKIQPNYGKIPLYFIANKGQVDAQALFYARTSSYTLWITEGGLVFDSTRREKVRPGILENTKVKRDRRTEKNERDVSRLFFLRANKAPEITAIEPTEHRANYLIGNDPSKWRTDIQTSKSVGYKELYPKIDLKVYGAEKQIEYDWVIQPGGKAEDIRFEYLNVQGTRLEGGGNLIVRTKFGGLIHRKPTSYQIIAGHKVEVDAKFQNLENNIYGFQVRSYDKDYPLIIDPQVLFYSTYLGGGRREDGSETEQPGDIAVDSSGCAYVTGYTSSPDFPIRNAYDSSLNGSSKIFITKFNAAGNDLTYSTFLGGNTFERNPRIAVDSSGCAYVTGETGSSDFPTYHAYDDTLDGYQDIFVTKLTASGNALVYSTYLGGSVRDYPGSIAVDNANSAYISGTTESRDFPVVNAFQSTMRGLSDGFITKIAPSGNSLSYSTYFGGSDYEVLRDIAVDRLGCAYVTGLTLSIDLPTKNAYHSTNNGGYFGADIFLAKFSSDGRSLVYSTYFGTEDDEESPHLAVDDSGCAYLAGYTISPNFPVVNAFDSTWNGIYDAYVTKFSAKGDSLIYSTYLGGRIWDFGTDIAVDNSGGAYVVGYTDSWDFPTKNAYQSSKAGEGGVPDIFVAQFSPSGNPLIFSTYFGGADGGESDGKIALDKSGNIYIMGETTSENFPLRNAFDSSLASWQDLFVASFCLLFPPLNFAVQRLPNNFIFYKEYVNRLTWQLNPENKINAIYKIYRKLLGAPDSAYKLIATVKENVFTYDDRTLKKNDFYSYRITSVDEKGHESESLEAHN